MRRRAGERAAAILRGRAGRGGGGRRPGTAARRRSRGGRAAARRAGASWLPGTRITSISPTAAPSVLQAPGGRDEEGGSDRALAQLDRVAEQDEAVGAPQLGGRDGRGSRVAQHVPPLVRPRWRSETIAVFICDLLPDQPLGRPAGARVSLQCIRSVKSSCARQRHRALLPGDGRPRRRAAGPDAALEMIAWYDGFCRLLAGAASASSASTTATSAARPSSARPGCRRTRPPARPPCHRAVPVRRHLPTRLGLLDFPRARHRPRFGAPWAG